MVVRLATRRVPALVEAKEELPVVLQARVEGCKTVKQGEVCAYDLRQMIYI